ncbi:MAG: tetratricopeptide repeat protein [Flavobacterium sp.]|nr:tetratricopeptide repeat protein [Flavobacterium sp.]
MKNYIYILLWVIILFCSCNDAKNVSHSAAPSDSIDIYLDWATSDSMSFDSRMKYNDRAFKILQERKNDSLTRVNLFKVANRYYNNGLYREYKNASIYVLANSVYAQDTNNIAKSYTYLGDYFLRTSFKDSAFYFYLKAEKIFTSTSDFTNLALININKANVLWNEKNYFASESAALEALKYLRYNPNGQMIFEAYTLVGIIANELGDYSKAIEYLNKAFETINQYKLNDNQQKATTHNNIGNVYQNLNKNGQAIDHFNRALADINLSFENPFLYAVLLDNLAYSRYLNGEQSSEIPQLFVQSIQVKDSLGNVSAGIFSRIRLAEYYLKFGEAKLGIELSRNALRAAKLNGNTVDELMPLKTLSALNIPDASAISRRYVALVDSLQKNERGIKDKFARIQFETEEITQKNDKLEAQNRNLFLFFIGTVMIGLLLFVIRTQRAKNRELLLKQAQQKANEDIYNLMLSQQNKIEEGRIREKKRIAQELHDGVLGRLFGARLNLDSLNKMEGGEAAGKRNDYLTELKNIEQDIREISHDLNREKFALINNFVAIYNNLIDEQAASHSTEVRCNIDDTIQWEIINNNLKINLYRITQEAFQNVNKYAKAKLITVNLKEKKGMLELTITDDGVGFDVERKSRGIGLQNMTSRVQESDGTINIESKKGAGTKIKIAFRLHPIIEIPKTPTHPKKKTA